MATLGSLVISLTAQTAQFTAAMGKAEYAAKKASDNIVGALKVVGVAMAGMFSLSKMDATITRITTMESNLVKAAARLNTTAETLSSFSIIARKAGMDNDAFIMTLTRIEKGMSAAASTTEQATGKYDENGEEILKTSKTYDELGINVQELIKLPLDQQLQAIAKAMKENIAPADRVRVAMELGGKGAAGMVAPLMEGGEALQKMTERAKELMPMTDQMAKTGAAVKSAGSDMTLAWDGFAAVLVDKVGPAITYTLSKLTDLIVEARKAQSINMVDVVKQIHQGGVAGAGGTEGLTGGGGGGGWGGEVFKDPVRPSGKTGGGKGGGKGGGSGDMGLDRMSTIIDTLTKDLAKLTQGSLAEITAWGAHMRNEITKVGAKGAETSVAMALVDKTETAKKLKATEDYNLFVAKASGDTYKEIEGQAKADLEKYKGFASAKSVTDAEMARKKHEFDRKNETDSDNMLKGYLSGMAEITVDLKEQWAWKKRILDLEIKMSHQALEDSIKSKGKGLSPDMANEQRALLAMTNQTKKFKHEWDSVQSTTAEYGTALRSVAGGFASTLQGIATGTMTVSQGIVSMLTTVQDAILTMIMNMVMKWAEGQIIMMMMNEATLASQAASSTASVAIDSAETAGKVANAGVVAGAKAYSAYAGIPWIGIALGAVAAAVVMGAIFALKGSMAKSSAGGDYEVGGTDLRTVHQGETILPAWAANSWRDIVSRGAMPGGGPGENGGGNTQVIHLNIDARGAQKGIDWKSITKTQIVPQLQKLNKVNRLRVGK